MTAVAEQIGSWLEQFDGAGGLAVSGAARGRLPTLRGAGFPDHARRRVAVHQRRADRAGNVCGSRRRRRRADIDQLAPWTAGNRLVFVNGLLVETVPATAEGRAGRQSATRCEPHRQPRAVRFDRECVRRAEHGVPESEARSSGSRAGRWSRSRSTSSIVTIGGPGVHHASAHR